MPTRPGDDSAPDPRLLQLVRRVSAAAVCLVLILPIARQTNVWVGWLPLWLLAMPLLSWWSLHRFRLCGLPQTAAGIPRRRSRIQARRIRRHRSARWSPVASRQAGTRSGLC